MPKFISKFSLSIIFSLIICLNAAAQELSTKPFIKVGVRPNPESMIRQEDGTYTGFEAEIWKEVARRVGFEYSMDDYPDFSGQLQTLKRGDIDAALAGLTITAQRAQDYIFSVPYMVSGPSILVPVRKNSMVLTIFHAFLSPIVWQTILIFFGFAFLFGNIFWFIERRYKKSEIGVSRQYFPGVIQSMWYAFVINSHVHVGHIKIKHWGARLLVVPLWIVGLLLLSIMTAQLVSEFSHNKDYFRVRNARDLHKRIVATVEGTTSDDLLRKMNVKEVVTTQNSEIAYEMLKEGLVDAMVYDFTEVSFYAYKAEEEGFHFEIVPGKLQDEFFGFGFNKDFATQNQELILKINDVLRELRDTGYIVDLQQKWLHIKSPVHKEIDYSKGGH